MKRSIATNFVRLLAYPVLRPMQDVRGSATRIMGMAADARQHLSEGRANRQAVDSFLDGLSPKEKFAKVYALNGWTEEALASQFRSARLARLGTLAALVLLLPACLWLTVSAPLWVSALVALASIFFCAASLVQCARLAWWEVQIESRELFPLGAFLGRADFFKRSLLP